MWAAFFMYQPSWKKHEEKMKNGDSKTAEIASIQFQEEREKEMKTSEKARRWEEDRKNEWKENKPLWKKKTLRDEKEKQTQGYKKLLDGGYFNSGIHPAPGYVLISVEKQVKSESGIIIASTLDDSPNSGYVCAVGSKLILDLKEVEPFVKEGDKILIKRGAGLDLTIKDKEYKLIYFFDILGVFEDA